MAQLLVVDDDRDLRDLIVQRIVRDGHQVVAADGGPGALDLIVLHPHLDAVVLDVGMPGMDGFELLDLLRERRPGLPALILTVLWTADVRERVRIAGAHYLSKPFTAATLRAAVDTMLAPAVDGTAARGAGP